MTLGNEAENEIGVFSALDFSETGGGQQTFNDEDVALLPSNWHPSLGHGLGHHVGQGRADREATCSMVLPDSSPNGTRMTWPAD